MSQFDLFATMEQRDEFLLSVPHVAATTTPADGVSTGTAPHAGSAMAHWPRCRIAEAPSNATVVPLMQPESSGPSYPPIGRPRIVTVDGRLLSVPEPWTPSDRLAMLQHLVHDAVGAPVHWRRVAAPRAPGLKPRRTGNLYRVGDAARDVIVHVHGGDLPDARQGRIALHTTRLIADEMARYRTALQCVVTRVRRPGHLDVLVVATIPWDLLAPVVEDRLTTGDGVRASLQCEIACDESGLRLRIPEADRDVSRHAGVRALVTALQGHPHEPWRSWKHADWMAVVSTVLTLRDGLHCSVAPLDARKRVTHGVLEELGLHGVHGHRLDLPAATREALMYTDVLAAPSPALRRHPGQPLIAVEIDAKSDMTAVQELALRLRSADRLGLSLTRAIVVAEEAKRRKFEERRELLRDELAGRLEFWPMDRLYREYQVARAERLQHETQRRRDTVRRVA